MEDIIEAVLNSLPKAGLVEVEVSARHVHLTSANVEILFGPGATLTPKRPLSQPGQYLCEERVTIVGPKGKKERTAVLGPVRPDAQVELSKSDCVDLGVWAPVRESGDVSGSGVVTLIGPKGTVELKQGAIVAQSHIHLRPETAKAMGLVDKQHVRVEVMSDRPVTFRNVVIRVSEKFRDRMHVDFDEANAAQVNGFTLGRVVR